MKAVCPALNSSPEGVGDGRPKDACYVGVLAKGRAVPGGAVNALLDQGEAGHVEEGNDNVKLGADIVDHHGGGLQLWGAETALAEGGDGGRGVVSEEDRG